MTLPVRTVVDDPVEHVADHGALHDSYNGLGEDRGIRYVAPGGNDEGIRQDSPAGTVAAAVQSLPTYGAGSSLRHAGKVVCYGGVIVETETIEYNAGLTIEGQGTGSGIDGAGTTIQRGHAGHLFAPTPAFGDWGHHLVMRSLKLDGNKFDFPEVADLVRVRKGGFNTAFHDVFWRQSSGWGVVLEQHAVNCYFYNASATGCDAGWMYSNIVSTGNLYNVGIFGAQVDNCGPAPIYVSTESGGDANILMVYGLKCESVSGGHHDYIIQVDTVAGVNPLFVVANGINAYRSDGLGVAVCKRTTSGGGTHPRWNLSSIHGAGYNLAFQDDVTALVSIAPADNHIYGAFYSDGARGIQMAYTLLLSGTTTPEGTTTASPGSLYQRTDGTAWIKATGTGNTGWLRLATV